MTSMKKVKPFYKSTPWLKVRLVVLLRDIYICQMCYRNELISSANTVHHIKSLEDYPELGLDEDNLESICPSCHNKEHPEKSGGKKKEPLKQRRAVVIKSQPNQEQY